MNRLQIELNKITESIINGEVDGIRCLPEMEDSTMHSYDYVHLIVRSMLIEKVVERMEKRRRGRNYLFGSLGLTTSLLILLFFIRGRC